MVQYRFYILFTTLLALLVGAPLVRHFSTGSAQLAQGIVTGLFILLLLSAVFAVAETRLTTRVAIALAVPVLVFEVLQVVFPGKAFGVPAYLLSALYLAYVIFVVVRFLFTTDRANANTICAAVCVYLLLGILGALLISTVTMLGENPYKTAQATAAADMRFGGSQSSDVLYFSFVTLTTLGYGDVTPTSHMAKLLAVAEAVVGQLFLAVLVARLVGLQIMDARGKGGS